MARLTGYDEENEDIFIREEERLLSAKGFITKDEMYKITRHLAEKLFEYEQLEDDGLLVKLPCKVGTTVYHIVPVDTENRKAIIEHEADLFFIMVATVEERWDKTVFLTEQEAEESLRKE